MHGADRVRGSNHESEGGLCPGRCDTHVGQNWRLSRDGAVSYGSCAALVCNAMHADVHPAISTCRFCSAFADRKFTTCHTHSSLGPRFFRLIGLLFIDANGLRRVFLHAELTIKKGTARNSNFIVKMVFEQRWRSSSVESLSR